MPDVADLQLVVVPVLFAMLPRCLCNNRAGVFSAPPAGAQQSSDCWALLLIPPLLFGLYVAKKRGKMITKGEACDLMGVDKSTTGPKFIKALEDDDLISVDSFPEIDKRKDFITATLRLEQLVESELVRLARNLKHFAGNLSALEFIAGIDIGELSRVPAGRPSSDNLLPVDWPPDEVGMTIKKMAKLKTKTEG